MSTCKTCRHYRVVSQHVGGWLMVRQSQPWFVDGVCRGWACVDVDETKTEQENWK